MTTITFNQDNIVIKGHSNYSYEGYDIVCSSISVMSQFLYNNEPNIEIELREAYIRLYNIKKHNQHIVGTFKAMVTELSRQYPNNVKVIT